MQGALTVVVAFVLAAAVPAASSAQQAPGVGLPPLPPVVPTVPAPAPSVPGAEPSGSRAAGTECPGAERSPGSRTRRAGDGPDSAPCPGGARPPGALGGYPQSVTGASGPVAPGAAPGASDRATGADAPGQEGAESAARVGAPGLPPGSARRATGASARLRGVKGVPWCPGRRSHASWAPASGRGAAWCAHFAATSTAGRRGRTAVDAPLRGGRRQPAPLSRGGRHARPLSGRVRRGAAPRPTGAGAGSACQVGGAGDDSTLPGYVASGPGSNGRALGATPADSGSQQAAIRVPRRRASGAEPREREPRSGLSIPLALDGERAGSFVIAALVLMAALAGLG
jgi:hypothetical protein